MLFNIFLLLQYSKYAMLIIMNWTITYFSESLQQEILCMPAGFLARYLRYTDRMEVFGPDLGMPHTRAIGDGLFELRLKAGEGIARVFYCTMVGNNIMMLHQFIKKTDKAPPREIDTARRRMKEVKNAHAQRT
jgi:phage-related protein